jgi:signal transduction histidine kinase
VTTPQRTLHLAIQSVLALAHLVPLVFLLFQRHEKRGRVLLPLYGALSATWGLMTALAVYRDDDATSWVSRTVDCASQDLLVLLASLLVSVTFLNFGRRFHWIWGFVGGLWFAAACGLHALFGSDAVPAQAATGASIAGWLVFSCLAAILSALWTLRAPLTFYRNRGIYWLGLLIPLLAGQGMMLAQFQWREIGLALHLLGTAGAVAFTRISYLPNIKDLLRSTISFAVLALTAALLYLLGLLAIQPLLLMEAGLYATVIGAVVVAITLSLLHHPIQRFVTRILNSILWEETYDPAQTIREYGRTISNVIDIELLATLAMGTIHEALEIERGALMVASTTEGHVSFQVIDGFGKASRKKITLTVHSPILSHLALRAEPLFQYDLEHNPDLQRTPAKEKKQLSTLGMEIYMPILTQDRLLGLLALGPQQRGEPYGPREVALLSTLAQQTASALENARLFDKLRTLNVEITQLNEDLQQAYRRLKKLNEAKSDFLSISSHELRTPLTVIQGYTDILDELVTTESLSQEQVAGIVERLKEATERLAQIVTAMLDASAVEAEVLDLSFASTTLQAVMSMAIGPWREAARERQIKLIVEGVNDIPTMEVDVQWLCQALSNLISNGIKYTPDGGRVTIQASMTDDYEHVEIVIADTGVGIAPEDQDLIFEKFYRAEDLLLHSTGDTKFKGAGPGLGLHIARGIIEAHNGRIWVKSEGHDEERCPGSTFHIVLPLQAGLPTAE